MSRKLTPEELKQLGIKAEQLKNKAVQQRQEVINEFEKQVGKELPIQLKDSTILDW
jgi:hypothetical protein